MTWHSKKQYAWVCLAGMLITMGSSVAADNIVANNEYAWAENVGWFNFKPNQGPGVTVGSTALTGYVWAENIGWINLSPITYGGVANDGSGNLSGYAWGENVGWINFDPQVSGDPTYYGVTIDSAGNFSGWAWGENIGWISMSCVNTSSCGTVGYGVEACVVDFEELAGFIGEWLATGTTLTYDLPPNDDNIVDLGDFSQLSAYWLDFCPGNWW